MDYAPSESQRLLADAARAFLADHCGLAVLEAMAQGAEPPDLWPGIAELGWAGLLVPERDGGIGGSWSDAVLLVEAMGYAAAPSPFVSSALVATYLVATLGDEAQRADRLPGLASGRHRIAVAIAEESGEASLPAVRLRVARDRLSGAKRFVKDADRADEILTVVRGAEGPGAVLVPRAAAALAPMATVSGERLFAVGLAGVEIGRAQWLGSPSGGGASAATLEAALAGGALARAAEMVGLAQRILDLCTEYAKVREQSGQPIGAFQAIQHHCADMLREVEAARFLTYRAAWGHDRALAGARLGAPVGAPSGDEPWSADPAMAKAYAGEACLAVARRGHQVMGAIAYCEEHPLHLLHKRIQAAALDYGDSATHLDRVAEAIGLD